MDDLISRAYVLAEYDRQHKGPPGGARKIMEEADVTFQTAELGKVDLGGGGTIAYILSLYGMQVIDCGVPVLNMHAPWEITSKEDICQIYECYKAFLKIDN